MLHAVITPDNPPTIKLLLSRLRCKCVDYQDGNWVRLLSLCWTHPRWLLFIKWMICPTPDCQWPHLSIAWVYRRTVWVVARLSLSVGGLHSLSSRVLSEYIRLLQSKQQKIKVTDNCHQVWMWVGLGSHLSNSVPWWLGGFIPTQPGQVLVYHGPKCSRSNGGSWIRWDTLNLAWHLQLEHSANISFWLQLGLYVTVFQGELATLVLLVFRKASFHLGPNKTAFTENCH